jgi:hypothetical protein
MDALELPLPPASAHDPYKECAYACTRFQHLLDTHPYHHVEQIDTGAGVLRPVAVNVARRHNADWPRADMHSSGYLGPMVDVLTWEAIEAGLARLVLSLESRANNAGKAHFRGEFGVTEIPMTPVIRRDALLYTGDPCDALKAHFPHSRQRRHTLRVTFTLSVAGHAPRRAHFFVVPAHRLTPKVGRARVATTVESIGFLVPIVFPLPSTGYETCVDVGSDPALLALPSRTGDRVRAFLARVRRCGFAPTHSGELLSRLALYAPLRFALAAAVLFACNNAQEDISLGEWELVRTWWARLARRPEDEPRVSTGTGVRTEGDQHTYYETLDGQWVHAQDAQPLAMAVDS